MNEIVLKSDIDEIYLLVRIWSFDLYNDRQSEWRLDDETTVDILS
jgi:hypothetical protein